MSSDERRVLLANLREPGCPACRAAGVAERRTMRWFLRENYGEAPTLMLLRTRPICVRHASPMLAGDNRHLTRTFEFLTKARLQEVSQRPRRSVVRWRATARREVNACLICEAGRSAAKVAELNVINALGLEAGRAAYARHEGFCLPHHDEAVKRAPPEVASWLEEQLRVRLESLVELFLLYDRRRDVRFQHEPKGAEQEAWRRALRLFWGDADAFTRPDDFRPPPMD